MKRTFVLWSATPCIRRLLRTPLVSPFAGYPHSSQEFQFPMRTVRSEPTGSLLAGLVFGQVAGALTPLNTSHVEAI